MAIIKVKKKLEKEQIRISIENNLLEKIKKYCEWAGVTRQEDFFEQAAEYILSKDKDWITHTSKQASV